MMVWAKAVSSQNCIEHVRHCSSMYHACMCVRALVYACLHVCACMSMYARKHARMHACTKSVLRLKSSCRWPVIYSSG